jgi:hypothetical protein
MLREIILLSIGAIFGLGATMVGLAAPSHFPNTSPLVWHWLFWGGITLMALMVVDGALILFWSDDGRPKLYPALLLNFAFCLAAVALIWHYSSGASTRVSAVNFAYIGTLAAAEDHFLDHFAFLKNHRSVPILNLDVSLQKMGGPNDPLIYFRMILPILYQEGTPFVPVGTAHTLRLGAGEYWASIRSQEGSFSEKLVLRDTPAGLKREILVYKDLPPGQGGMMTPLLHIMDE